jgi:accessory gene regulator B
MNKLKSKNKYNEQRLIEMRYGLESFYLTITKLVVITILAILLGIFKEYIIFTLMYIPLRTVSFGWHANTTKACWIISPIAFLLIPYLGSILEINLITKIIVLFISLIIFYLYAPADTKKRPIVAPKRRLTFKLLSISVILIYSIFIINFSTLTTNLMILAIVYQCLLINPITYKLSNQPFDNYKNYCLNE